MKSCDPLLASKSYLNTFNQDPDYKTNRTRKRAGIIKITTLKWYRQIGYSVSCRKTNPNSQIWYVYAQKRNKNIGVKHHFLGRFNQQFLFRFFSPKAVEFRNYLNLNSIISKI